jgi:hypothetical protein
MTTALVALTVPSAAYVLAILAATIRYDRQPGRSA